jgi:hypothetical protein
MTKNQKIALGCGGAGCLGIVVVAIAGVVLYFFLPGRYSRGLNSNMTTNRNYNSDSNANGNLNADSNSNTNNTNTSTSSSGMSDDDRHRLYQAASMSGDAELLRRVSVKLGLMNADFTPGDEYLSFVKDHVSWALRNGDFIQSINTQEKAVEYVNEHFPD